MREDSGQKAEGKRSGLGVTLLCSVSVNLAELRRAQTRFRALAGKIFANEVIEITLEKRP